MSRPHPLGTANRFAVQTVERNEARPLVTIAPDHPYWTLKPGETCRFQPLEGAIVRVQPPPGATDVQVDWLRGRFVEDHGAAKVRVDTWSKAAQATIVSDVATVAKQSARDVVMSLADKSHRSQELRALLDEVLTEVGL